MKKQALAIALASVVGTFAAGAALAQQNGPPGPPNPGAWTNPPFNAAERSGFCLIESALSIVAANVAHYGCAAASGKYFLDVAVDYAGQGTADLDGVALSNTLGKRITGKGQTCTVTQASTGKLFTPRTGAEVSGYIGNHVWSYTNTIFLDQAPPFSVAKVLYDEHSIKDFYTPAAKEAKCTSTVCKPEPTSYDYGLEVITKTVKDTKGLVGYPREKWWQRSAYKREDGTPEGGTVLVAKNRLAPAVPCSIGLYLDGWNGATEFYYTGDIIVTTKVIL